MQPEQPVPLDQRARREPTERLDRQVRQARRGQPELLGHKVLPDRPDPLAHLDQRGRPVLPAHRVSKVTEVSEVSTVIEGTRELQASRGLKGLAVPRELLARPAPQAC